MSKVLKEKIDEELGILQELKKDQDDYSRSINQYKLEFEEIQRELLLNKDKVFSLNKDINSLNERKDKINLDIKKQEEINKELSREIFKLNKELYIYKTNSDKEIDSLDKDILFRKNTLDNVNNAINLSNKKLDTLKNNVSKEESNLKKISELYKIKDSELKLILKNTKTSLDKRNKDIVSKNEKIGKLNSDIMSSVDELSKINNNIKEKKLTLKNIKDELNNEISDLKSEILEIVKSKDEEKIELDKLVSKRISVAQRETNLRSKELYIRELYEKAGINFPQ